VSLNRYTPGRAGSVSSFSARLTPSILQSRREKPHAAFQVPEAKPRTSSVENGRERDRGDRANHVLAAAHAKGIPTAVSNIF